jgi:hypothetical protein
VTNSAFARSFVVTDVQIRGLGEQPVARDPILDIADTQMNSGLIGIAMRHE